MIISGRMRWDEQVACMGAMRNAYRTVVTKPTGRDQLRGLGLDWK
jgi:hypothetical protein